MEKVNLETKFDQYFEYLRSSSWAEKRNEALMRDEYHCSICGNPNNLEVHHLKYPSLLGTEPVSDLMTVCESCHKKIESYKKGHTYERGKWRPPCRRIDDLRIYLNFIENDEKTNVMVSKLREICPPPDSREGDHVIYTTFLDNKKWRVPKISEELLHKVYKLMLANFDDCIDEMYLDPRHEPIDFTNYF